MATYRVTIDVEVIDEAELLTTTRFQALDDMGGDLQAVEEMLCPGGEMDVEACLQMLFDPGVSPAGTEIEQSSVERLTGF